MLYHTLCIQLDARRIDKLLAYVATCRFIHTNIFSKKFIFHFKPSMYSMCVFDCAGDARVTTECENCGKAATIFCEDCGDNYCSICADVRHKHPARKHQTLC